MKRIIACLLIVSFFGQNLYSASGQIGSLNLAPLNFNLPVLRYLSVNSANPFNYFNFLLDQGDSLINKSQLDSHAKELIHYFFLGLTLPDEAFWVNLKPDEPSRVISEELSQTDMGQVLLKQDLQLKKDVSQYLHPQSLQGKEFWTKLYEAIGKDKAKKTEITTSNRVWIVPDEAVVMETEDGALVTSAKLKVLLESEYLQIKNKKPGLFSKPEVFSESQKQDLYIISENLMKEIILPNITKDINTSPTYAPLRQIYHSLILAQWFKRRHRASNSVYSFCIDKGYLKGLESELPWSKQALWQEYLESYQKGEYKAKEKLAGLNRMYVSGGIVFFGEEGVGNGLLTIIPLGKNANSPVTGKESLLPLLTLSSPLVPESGNFPYTEVSVIGKELTAGSPAVTEVDSASSGVEFTDAGRKVFKELENMLGRGGWSEIMNAVSDEEVKDHMRNLNQGHFYIPSYIDVRLLTIHEKVEILAMEMGCSFKEAHQIAKIFEERFRKYLLGSDGGLQDGIALPLPAAISHKEIVAVRTSPPQIIAEISTNGSIFPQTYYLLKLVQGPDGRVRGYLTNNSFKIWVDGEKELYPEYNFLNVLVEGFRYVYGQELDYLRQDHDFDRLLEHYEDLLVSISISQDETEREKLLEELRNKFIKPYIEYLERIIYGGLKKMNSDEKRKLLWAIFLNRDKEAVVKEMKKGAADNEEYRDYYEEEENLKAIDPETGDTITSSSSLEKKSASSSLAEENVVLKINNNPAGLTAVIKTEDKEEKVLWELSLRVNQDDLSLKLFRLSKNFEQGTPQQRLLNNFRAFSNLLQLKIHTFDKLIRGLYGFVHLDVFSIIAIHDKFVDNPFVLFQKVGELWLKQKEKGMSGFDLTLEDSAEGGLQLKIEFKDYFPGAEYKTLSLSIPLHQKDAQSIARKAQKEAEEKREYYLLEALARELFGDGELSEKMQELQQKERQEKLTESLSKFFDPKSSIVNLGIFFSSVKEHTESVKITYGEAVTADNGFKAYRMQTSLDGLYLLLIYDTDKKLAKVAIRARKEGDDFEEYVELSEKLLEDDNNELRNKEIIREFLNKIKKYAETLDKLKENSLSGNFLDLAHPSEEEIKNKKRALRQFASVEELIRFIKDVPQVKLLLEKILESKYLRLKIDPYGIVVIPERKKGLFYSTLFFENKIYITDNPIVIIHEFAHLFYKSSSQKTQGNIQWEVEGLTELLDEIKRYSIYKDSPRDVQRQEVFAHLVAAVLLSEETIFNHPIQPKYVEFLRSLGIMPEEPASITTNSPVQEGRSAALGSMKEVPNHNFDKEGHLPTGGIDLSQIELSLKDERFVSSLNPADLKVLRAAKALKDGWDSLSLLYVYEIMLLLKDNLINDLQNKSVLSEVLKTLKLRELLDPKAISFLNLIQAQRSVSEIKLALYRQFP